MNESPGDRHTILVVDDNSDALAMTARFLKRLGFEVVTSDTPLGVSSLIRRHAPALVVLDVMMPSLDGQSLARLIQSQPSTRTEIIFYSVLDEAHLGQLARATPSASFVSKTDGPMALHAAIRARLAARASRPPTAT